MPKTKGKILVEMSGGLDSSVAALLLQNEGWKVIGVMMKLHDSSSFNDDVNIAKKVAKKLNIQFEVVDFARDFQNNVINYFIETYKDAKTPNPCIVCNQTMKFNKILDFAKDLNCEKIATGHYARIKYENATYSLHRAKDLSKDQSYVLYFLSQENLAEIKFPLGDYTKDEVRKIAIEADLPCADKEESMDLCFTEGKAYNEYLMECNDYVPKAGNVVDTSGKVIGQHEGLINYTIGQRKGLGLAFGEPKYVIRLDKNKNEVVLGDENETYQNEVSVSKFSWVEGSAPAKEFKCKAKLRYRQLPKDCFAHVKNDIVNLKYPEGINAVTPGQFAVLYDGDQVLGGGIIVE